MEEGEMRHERPLKGVHLGRPKKREHVRKKKPKKRTPVPTHRMLQYAGLLAAHPNMRKGEAARLAGFSEKTRPAEIENSPGFAPLRARLEHAAERVGVTMEKNLSTLGGIAYSKENANSDRINAVKESNHMMGWRAPEQIEVTQTTVEVAKFLVMVRGNGGLIGEMIQQIRSAQAIPEGG